MLVEEQHGHESLVLGGRGYVFADREMRRETVDVACGQFARMCAAVKQDEAANRVEVGLLGMAAVMPGTQDFYHTDGRRASVPADQGTASTETDGMRWRLALRLPSQQYWRVAAGTSRVDLS